MSKKLDDKAELVVAIERRKRVASLLLRGITSRSELAGAMGVCLEVIRLDIEKIREDWRVDGGEYSEESDANQIRDLRMKRVRQMDQVLQLAHSEYNKSRQPRTEQTIRRDACGGCNGLRVIDGGLPCPTCLGTGEVISRTIKKVEQVGDPAYLNIAMKAITEASKLEGLQTTGSLSFKQIAAEADKLTGDGTEPRIEAEFVAHLPMERVLEAKMIMDKIRESGPQQAIEAEMVPDESDKKGEN